MNTYSERSKAIIETIGGIKTATERRADVEELNVAKSYLIELASKRDLFPADEFPMPTNGQNERTVCVYSEPDGRYAMYVNLVNQGAASIPHDHGKSWAIIAGIEGYEKHTFYECISSNSARRTAEVEKKAEIIVEPEMAVTMLVGGIHSIEATNPDPSMFLHCYGYAFDAQDGRREFDLESGTYSHTTNAVSQLEIMPLHHRDRR